MKKVYLKPDLFYESFSLMNAIAGCQVTTNSADQYTCAWAAEDFGGIAIFATGINPDCVMELSNIHTGITIGSATEDGTIFGS